MEEENKLPLKRVELSLSKFNEVAIPHHLDLLRQHKANIIKYEQNGQYGKVRAEQSNARRVASQLRSLLSELEGLRRQVKQSDLVKFDAMTRTSRDLTLKAIMDYLESTPVSITRPIAQTQIVSGSTDSVGLVEHQRLPFDDIPVLQLNAKPIGLNDREAALKGWMELQEELQQLHEAWQAMHEVVMQQREQVNRIEDNVVTTDENVREGVTSLSMAEKIKASAWGVGGAAFGAIIGGPVGLVAGAKAGAAALLAGSALGYVGARVLGKNRQLQIENAERKDE